jgi:hypothetical protein
MAWPYVAMAVGAPLGVMLNSDFGISGFAAVVVLVALIGLLFARTRQDVSVTAGIRAPFHVVVRKIWPYGLGLALGTVGFGVIATFITLYFSAHRWQGAAFTLSLFSAGFICVRLVAGNMITRYGGVRVSLVCFVVECLGLVIIWLAPSAWIAGLGALLTGSVSLWFSRRWAWKRSDRLKNKTRDGAGNLFGLSRFSAGFDRPAGWLGRRLLCSGYDLSVGRGGRRAGIPAGFSCPPAATRRFAPRMSDGLR